MAHYLNEAFFENEDFPFYIGAYKVDRDVELHSHEFMEMAYVAEGAGIHVYNGGENYRISAGDVFVIEPEAEHAYRTNKGTGLVVYNIIFIPALLKKEIEALSAVTPFVDFFYMEPFLRNAVRFKSHLKLELQEQLEMKNLLDRIIMEYLEKRLGYQIMTKTLLIELLLFLSRCYAIHQTHSPAPRSDGKILKHICEFIEHHYAKPLTLTQISQLCSMSPTAFAVKFKQFTGRTFIEYRNEIRIRVATAQLTQSDGKIMAISQEVGFDDLSFFNKLFKQYTGMSPGAYRKTNSPIILVK
ncbi:MAG TPA: AraC family transcriptional regulator [Bacilli bacterium]